MSSGGGDDVSLEALGALARACTGAGPPTTLSELLCEEAGCTSPAELIERFSRRPIHTGAYHGIGDLRARRIVPLVVSAAENGDHVAREIIQRTGTSLGESAAHVARKLSMQQSEFEVVLSGGLFRNPSLLLTSSLELALKQAAPGAKLVPLEALPVVGAALLAMERATGESQERVHSFLGMGIGRVLQAA